MRRKIIEIDDTLCNGCGDCVTGCAEGAIQIIDGKARLVREDFCDGFGDCVGVCPTGALKVIEREAAQFDELATVAHLRKSGGDAAVQRYAEAQQRHAGATGAAGPSASGADRRPFAPHGGCPGAREIKRQPAAPGSLHAPARPAAASGAAPGAPVIIPSELAQWPVQLHLVRPGAPFFRDRELVIMSTCGPLASAEVHQRYLRGRGVVVACPKLDDTESYAEKLGAIMAEPSIPRVIVVVMEVPCCRGLTLLAEQGHRLSGRDDLIVEEHVLALTGELRATKRCA